jgi:hypothetical protein
VATAIAANAGAAFMPAIEPHTHQWLNDLAAARPLATGKTKDLPGFGWLTGFVVFTPRRPTMCPVMPCMSNDAFQADAVFAPWLQRGDEPSKGQVRQAVATAIRAFGYSGGAA